MLGKYFWIANDFPRGDLSIHVDMVWNMFFNMKDYENEYKQAAI